MYINEHCFAKRKYSTSWRVWRMKEITTSIPLRMPVSDFRPTRDDDRRPKSLGAETIFLVWCFAWRVCENRTLTSGESVQNASTTLNTMSMSSIGFRDSSVVIIETGRTIIRGGLGLHELLRTPTIVSPNQPRSFMYLTPTRIFFFLLYIRKSKPA